MTLLRGLTANRNAGFLRSVVFILLAIVGASLVVWFAGRLIGIDEHGAVAQAFKSAAHSPWAFLLVAATFTAVSFIGAPQFLLIALCVAAFGPVRGFAYAYAATLISASVNFLVARFVGANWLRSHQPGTIKTLSEFVGRNGFFSAMIVRIVPSAPFVVVNMGLGLTATPYLAFIAGTAIGTIPKTAVIALLGKVVERARAGDTAAITYLTLAIVAWLALALAARWLLQRRNRQRSATAGTRTAPPAPSDPNEPA